MNPRASDPGRSQRFPAALRLKQSREFAEVRREGRRLAAGCLVANWKTLETGRPSRLGLVTSRKVGGAVQRNRARRLLRESFRLHRGELGRSVLLVLVARPSIVGKTFAEVERDFLAVLRRASLLASP